MFRKIFALPIFAQSWVFGEGEEDEGRTDVYTRPDSSNTIQPCPPALPEPTTTASAITALTSLPVLLLISLLPLSFIYWWSSMRPEHDMGWPINIFPYAQFLFFLNQCPILFFLKSLGKKPVACLGHLDLFILSSSGQGWKEVFTSVSWRHSSLCGRPRLTTLFSPHSWYQNSWENANYPKTLISVYILKTLRPRSRSPLHTFKTTLKYEIIWWYDALDRCEYEI